MSGHKVHLFIEEHLSRVKEKDDQSNHWYWNCKFCTVDDIASCHIESQDNKLFLHVIDTKACPNGPAEVGWRAEIILIRKGKVTFSKPVLSILDSSTSGATSSDDTQLVVVKKRKAGGNLDHYVDQPLTPHQKADMNVMFFRYLHYLSLVFVTTLTIISGLWYVQTWPSKQQRMYSSPNGSIKSAHHMIFHLVMCSAIP